MLSSLKSWIKSKLFWMRIAFCLGVVLFSYGLAFCSEAAAQQTLSNMRIFLEGAGAAAALRNTALMSALLIFAVTLITTKLSAGVGIVGIGLFAMHLTSGIKIMFRNEPFYPWDVSLVQEATNIVSKLDIVLTKTMIAGLIFVILGLVLAVLADIFWMKKLKLSYRAKLLSGLAALGLFIGCGCGLFSDAYLKSHEIVIRNWDQLSGYQEYGFVYSFIANYKNAKINSPAGYGEAAVLEIAGRAEDLAAEEKNAGPTVENPNIIILMSEAFTDINSSAALHFEQDITPTLTALQKSYLSGRALTQQYGGGTANSEFEVLTSYSPYYLPGGTIAYMSYVNSGTNSYVSFLKDQGYSTIAAHPYLRTFFSREKAYAAMGFDAYYSEEDFEGAERIRWDTYISDAALTDKIIALYEENLATGKPFFNHAVSMQNHASYGKNDYPEEDTVSFESDVELSEEEYGVLASYATGIRLSDLALGRLIEYFEQVEESTVIVFFGDHMPHLGVDNWELLERIGYLTGSGEEKELRFFSTPYIIWNNFEEEPVAQSQDLSMFQLLPYMTRSLGLSRPTFYAYMDGLTAWFYGVTPNICLDAQGNPVFELEPEAWRRFEEYWMIVYDGLIGKGYANQILYQASG